MCGRNGFVVVTGGCTVVCLVCFLIKTICLGSINHLPFCTASIERLGGTRARHDSFRYDASCYISTVGIYSWNISGYLSIIYCTMHVHTGYFTLQCKWLYVVVKYISIYKVNMLCSSSYHKVYMHVRTSDFPSSSLSLS